MLLDHPPDLVRASVVAGRAWGERMTLPLMVRVCCFGASVFSGWFLRIIMQLNLGHHYFKKLYKTHCGLMKNILGLYVVSVKSQPSLDLRLFLGKK